jgi:hypothetical protein
VLGEQGFAPRAPFFGHVTRGELVRRATHLSDWNMVVATSLGEELVLAVRTSLNLVVLICFLVLSLPTLGNQSKSSSTISNSCITRELTLDVSDSKSLSLFLVALIVIHDIRITLG